MNYQRNYVPKKSKVNYKIVVPFLLLVVILGVALYQLFPNETETELNPYLQFCGLNPKQAQDIIYGEEIEETRTFKDYGLYGETLGLYEDTYQLGNRDALMGKTIYITNLCNGDEYSFLMGMELDSKIPIEQLSNGMYSAVVLNGLTHQRLTSEEVIRESFTALSINNETKEIQMIADKTAFKIDAQDEDLENNYLYFNVSTQVTDEDVYDIILDPNGLTFYENGNTDYGAQRKDLVEANEMYDLALGVKEKLEEKGLKVNVIRDQVSPIAQFGPGSRTELAYQSKAKYYFQFNLKFSFYKPDKGMTIVYSSYSTNGLATSIMESLNESTDLIPSNYTSGNNVQGVFRSQPVDKLDSRHVIRELGGQFTGAGKHEEFKEIHKRFANEKIGMQAVSIDYGFINDDQTYDTWVSQKDAIIEATANGILKGLRIK